jgi:hypothetical protein
MKGTPPPTGGIYFVGKSATGNDVATRHCDSLYEIYQGNPPGEVALTIQLNNYGGIHFRFVDPLPSVPSWEIEQVFFSPHLRLIDDVLRPEYKPYTDAMVRHLLNRPDFGRLTTRHISNALITQPHMVTTATLLHAFLSRGRVLRCSAMPSLNVAIHRDNMRTQIRAFFADRISEWDQISFHFVGELPMGRASTFEVISATMDIYQALDVIDWENVRSSQLHDSSDLPPSTR